MSKPPLVLREHIYIPVKVVDMDLAEKHYIKHFYEEKVCRRCPYKRDRFSEFCANCELGGYKGGVNLLKRKMVGGTNYVGFPIGDRLNLEDKIDIDFDDFKIIDKRKRVPMDKRIKFVSELRDYQIEILGDWSKAKHGLLKAPPRSGKTITTLAIAIKMGQRTVIIADQKDFLDNFLEEMEAHTNIKQIQELAGKKIYGFLKKKEDFENFQIGLATYQSFIKDSGMSEKRLKWLKDNFGMVWCDEIHRANATLYAKFISKLPALYKGGCTATDVRKDGRHIIIENLVGPVVAETTVDSMKPVVTVHATDCAPKNRNSYTRGPAAWTYANRFLSKHPARNKKIIEGVVHDLRAGRSIVMAVMFKEHVKELVDGINNAFGEKIAIGFTGGGGEKNKRERIQIIQDARAGKVRVVVGIRRLMQLGLNVPRWDTLYMVSPISNKPNWEQESRRICTPMEGKKQPLIRMFVDIDMPISFGCFKNTLGHSIELGYRLSKKANRVYGSLLDKKLQRPDNDSGMYDSEERDAYSERKSNKKKKSGPNIERGLFSMFGNMAKK
jgi:superfamily II DNA or RNA helicase